MTYRIAAPLQTYEEPPMYIPHQGRMYIALWGRSLYRSYERNRRKKASSIGQKSGFGSAGARSSAS